MLADHLRKREAGCEILIPDCQYLLQKTVKNLANDLPKNLVFAFEIVVDGKRRELSHRATLFCDDAAVGGIAGPVFPDALLAV